MTMENGDWTGRTLANGRYLILAKLGEGGMGAVYQARDQNIDTDVVIKVPLPTMLADLGFTRRFKEEIRSLVRLSHPHIVKVSDVGDSNGAPFAVMQFLAGGSLEDRRPTGPAGSFGSADPREIAGWLGGVASALDYVHAQGYVHRDVKPANILFDAEGHPFLSDFGVAKALTGEPSKPAMTGAGMVVGTAEYMAPELVMGEPFDGRVDQYALATTVYEILCGRSPFEDPVKTRVLVLQTSKEPPRLSDVGSWIPIPVSDAVLKGLSKNPADRYANCRALADAVAAAIEATFAGQPERTRFKCVACGRTLALSTSDCAKLRRNGRVVPCPACKAPFQLPTTDTRGDGAVRSGTAVEGGMTGSGEQPISGSWFANESDPAMPPPLPSFGNRGAIPPAQERSGTVIEPIVAKRPAATQVEQPAVKRAPATMIEQPGLQRPRGTVVEQTPPSRSRTVIEPAGDRISDTTPPGARQGAGHSASPAPIPTWAVIAASGAVACLGIIIGFAVLRPAPDKAPLAASNPMPQEKPVAVESGIKPNSTPPADERSIRPSPEPPSQPPAVAINPVSPMPNEAASAAASAPITPAPEEKPPISIASRSNAQPAPGDRPVYGSAAMNEAGTPPSRSEPSSTNSSGTGNGDTSTSAPSFISPGELRLVKGDVPIEKILKSPGDYANKLVVVSEVFCLGDTVLSRPDGSVEIPVIEGTLDFQSDGGTGSIKTLRKNQFNLDVDLAVAEHLVSLKAVRRISGSAGRNPTWGDNVAIVTLAVTKQGEGESRAWSFTIVKLEILVNLGPQVVTVARKRRLRVVYNTVTVGPEATARGLGKPEDWAQPERLQHVANQLNNLIETKMRQLSDTKWAQFNNQFNTMFSTGMRNAIQQNQIDAQIQMERATPRRVFP